MKIAKNAFGGWTVWGMVALFGCSPHVALGRGERPIKGAGGDVGSEDGGGAGGASGGGTGSGGNAGGDNSGGVSGFAPEMPVVTCIPEPLTGRNPNDLPTPSFCPCTRRDGQGSLNCP